jgi:hypothetical protein
MPRLRMRCVRRMMTRDLRRPASGTGDTFASGNDIKDFQSRVANASRRMPRHF